MVKKMSGRMFAEATKANPECYLSHYSYTDILVRTNLNIHALALNQSNISSNIADIPRLLQQLRPLLPGLGSREIEPFGYLLVAERRLL